MIGNYLQDKKGRLCKVEGIKTDSFYAYPIEGAISTLPYEAIPLSPELLERCGWLKYSDDCYLFKLNDSGMLRLVITFSCGDIITAISDIYSIQEKIIILSEAIQHLHQLQNIIKTLTGQELKIK